MPQKKNNSNNSEKPQNAYFLSLELENVRCFGERQKIDFSDGNGNPRQWTIILGDNGTGKTTLLQSLHLNPAQSIALSLEEIYSLGGESKSRLSNLTKLALQKLGPPFVNIDRYSIRIRYTVHCSIIVARKLTDKTKGRIVSSKNFGKAGNLEKFINDFQKLLVFAYGATRKAGKTSISNQNEESSYKTLFDEAALLMNPEEWLLQADYASKRISNSKKKRKNALELIKEILMKILPDVDDIRFSEIEIGRTPKPIVEFHTPYGWVEAKDLSLGYRTSMAWMVDFASRMFDLYPESENPLAEPAVVLIDEIDLHLHPKWQRELIDYLTNLFPNTQFIVTTHSPLIVQAAAARDANIVVCRREGDHVVIDQTVEAVKNWRSDQILTSDLFGLETARPKETGKLLKERKTILSKAKLTKKDEKRLAELDEEIGFLPVSENQEDNEAMEIIRKAADWIKTQAK